MHVICGSNGRPKLLPAKYRKVFDAVAAQLAGSRA
jgi:hypothetical protein